MASGMECGCPLRAAGRICHARCPSGLGYHPYLYLPRAFCTAFISCYVKPQDHVGLGYNHAALDVCLQLHSVAVQGQHNGRTPQHAPGEHQASISSPLAGFPDVPFMEVLPAPALGLLTSALAVPGIVLGSILETNALPDFSSSPSVPTGEHIQPSSVTSGEHGIVVPKGCRLHVTPDIPCLKHIIFPLCNSHFKQASIQSAVLSKFREL